MFDFEDIPQYIQGISDTDFVPVEEYHSYALSDNLGYKTISALVNLLLSLTKLLLQSISVPAEG